MDFMRDPQRSGQFCVLLGPRLTLRTELRQRLRVVSNDPDIEPHSESFRAVVRADSNTKVNNRT
ncbi:hypothetical protein P691DRAFT_506495 [Macrolepiota fuliginosa MF-IS2]|uniref:Uncharacterized protein n=1 Tax=Macrolepiota fuliginosa MF-IS2 TaxID=1400762 RepID=A0A9P5X0Q2_9AGAR|nr:hypothetical protein P691DRAFT_506495 [Macrolepiota fuliginosa MF-IS2]